MTQPATVSDTRQELYVAAQAFAGSSEAHNLIDNFYVAVLRQAADAMQAQGHEDGFEMLLLMAREIENAPMLVVQLARSETAVTQPLTGDQLHAIATAHDLVPELVAEVQQARRILARLDAELAKHPLPGDESKVRDYDLGKADLADSIRNFVLAKRPAAPTT